MHHYIAGIFNLPFIHVLSVATLTGMTLHTSFVAGIIQFRTLPRPTFGNLQAKQFPVYFSIQAAAFALLNLTTYKLMKCPFTKALNVVGLSLALLNLVFIGPWANKVMVERHEKEKNKEDVTALSKKFGILHGVSSLANLGIVFIALFHCWSLAQYIK
ncbi:hypothetical protein HK103_004444 [Boothiomyces macroporosus]|uniref:TMEM205-like domain-containing protein n=1 Tax=Boothiomyces macroporosus TaxID=261099 RepID=A0AAD5Y8E1_9FUNG|nr:hypothetical protein HK103_004444 [Boothiomyces macroporosus]